ncbi:hypothetical protein JOF56_002264 [Kibdelosporangium banguiense]|uniref:Uncharacterized protein n=1 Tax=Kibdelosporangium banguiense TaxID=1365924 RepID=A0ABS4TD35_9PSEU|nr:hypothetical protein [Kibdelosporangium banguiense]MBP2321879.1 hypothetical protein [Kibdelosporangium banguiense]
MDTARTARGARLRRILSRAGLVLGGAVAGTAAAWLLSMSTASADELTPAQPDLVKPVADALGDTGQVGNFVGTVLPEPPAPPAPLEEFGQQVKGAVEQVTAGLNLPARTELGEPTAPAKLRLLSIGDDDVAPIVQPLAASPQLTPVAPAVTERAAAHGSGRALVTESPMQVQGEKDQELPALPRLPLPMPLTPPTVPAGACSSCGNGGGNDDFGIPVAHTWPSLASEFATSHALRLISQHVAPAAGEQPGVTPD